MSGYISGGYPGAATLASSESTWRSYVLDSLIETTLSRDILQLQKVTKPHLLLISRLPPPSRIPELGSKPLTDGCLKLRLLLLAPEAYHWSSFYLLHLKTF